MKRSSSGFTLVELIVVIVVLGILAAIGIPRYNKYVNESRLAHIQTDMKTISSLIEVVAMDDDGIYRGGGNDGAELRKAITEGRAYKEGNLLVDNIGLGGEFYLIEDPFVRDKAKSKLKGTFLIDENDELYYITDRKLKGINHDKLDIEFAKDIEFEWVPNSYGYIVEGEKSPGYYRYIGSDKTVKIPDKIKGNPIFSYYKMFEYTNVEKVISNNTNIIDMSRMFFGSQAKTIDANSLNTSKVKDMNRIFSGSHANTLFIDEWDTSSVTDMSYMFLDSFVEGIDLSKWNTSFVQNMDAMFCGGATTKLGIEDIDTSSVVSMANMFAGSSVKSLNLKKWNTSNVKNMSAMFLGIDVELLDISNFDTSNVTDMQQMFNSTKVNNLNLSSFDTSKVIDMNHMFSHSQIGTIDLSSFNTKSVVGTNGMFEQCTATVGYARTLIDANVFNSSTAKPERLSFVVR